MWLTVGAIRPGTEVNFLQLTKAGGGGSRPNRETITIQHTCWCSTTPHYNALPTPSPLTSLPPAPPCPTSTLVHPSNAHRGGARVGGAI